MKRLRGPEGCPWDRAQNYDSVKGLLLEEAYEVIDAINSRDFSALQEELGDLLFQVVFYARLAEEEKRFSIDEVIERIYEKLVRRHPHVFGPKRAHTPEEALESWNAVKRKEREARPHRASPKPDSPKSLLDGIPPNLPSALEAHELGMRAGEAGFDWATLDDLLDKIQEELGELKCELHRPELRNEPSSSPHAVSNAPFSASAGRVEEEVGDLLFAAANLARLVGSDPESCLRRANKKFARRFRTLERALGDRGKQVSECSPKELDAVWNAVKGLQDNSAE